MAILLDGKKTAENIRSALKDRVRKLAESGIRPGLSVTLVGEDPASKVYVASKDAAATETGIQAWTHRFPADISERDLADHLERQNRDPAVHGILLQLPLPSHLPSEKLLNLISARKDVDGFHPISLGNLVLGRPGFKPCTPWGVQVLLKAYNLSPEGKHVVVVGRSNIVGKPVANILMQKEAFANATVTVCHTGTPDLGTYTRQADFIIAAMGKPGVITGDMVKEGAVVVDVGVNRVKSDKTQSGFRLVGDVDFESVSKKAGYITPVPGGVGPMTIAMLLTNTVQSAEAALAEMTPG
ncbi:MAG TPA: bifunctional methylenetetrahydrofolate dehydrogenase/methenyltetrahydrofolate cyclohydrolase FolD [Fibrobacteria bacterium]|nr:bifunctional methylenetetrahydrofolate dehydrogenase/methenyltetrahydrofolate cyclohydrolase FolD [Fibrobacteria bacterium]